MKLIKRITHRFSHPMKQDRGFTLVELMISIVVFSVGVLAVATLQHNAMNSCTFAEFVSTNTIAAADQLEEFMAADDDDWRILTPGGENMDTPDGKMNLAWTIQPQAANGGTTVIALTATYIGNKIANRRDPVVNVTMIKPLVR